MMKTGNLIKGALISLQYDIYKGATDSGLLKTWQEWPWHIAIAEIMPTTRGRCFVRHICCMKIPFTQQLAG